MIIFMFVIKVIKLEVKMNESLINNSIKHNSFDYQTNF